jgi:hypothetical protein
MINIIINKPQKSYPFLPAEDLFDTPYGTVFQMYIDGVAQENFFISCGINEKRLIDIWYDDDNYEYRFSTSTRKNMSGFVSGAAFQQIEAEINMSCDINR